MSAVQAELPRTEVTNGDVPILVGKAWNADTGARSAPPEKSVAATCSDQGLRLATARKSMPFFLIPTALGVSFFLIWAFIGGMIFRESQLAVQRDQDSEVGRFAQFRPHDSRATIQPPKAKRARRKRPQLVS